MKIGFVQNETWFLFERNFGLVESYLGSRAMNILIGRGAYFLKNKIVYLIFRYFDSF
jgi:hypothetical protein